MSHQTELSFMILFALFMAGVLDETGIQSHGVEGAYFMHGTIVEQSFEFPWGEDHLVRSDTVTVSFVTTIRMVEEKEDTVQFLGLIGANAGRQNALPVRCEHPDNCGYAAFKMGLFQFDTLTPGGYFTGTGQLEGDLLSIKASFKYRGIGEIYELKGEKIELGGL